MALYTAYSGVYSCNEFSTTETGLFELNGQVIESGPGRLVIDSCPPNADCAPLLNQLEYEAPGLSLVIPYGTLLQVTVRVDQPMGCSHELLILNLPEWGGLPNPVLGNRHLWLAGSDGIVASLPDSPFTVESVPLGCTGDPNADDHLLHFVRPSTGNVLDVYMGQTVGWAWEDEYVTVRNLRSFETGQVDDYWNWGFFVVGNLLEG
jgi:hypothetical protein